MLLSVQTTDKVDGQTEHNRDAEEETEMALENDKKQDVIKKIKVSLEYKRMSTMASNQIAVWVENENGKVIKTLMVTDFTAANRGYRERDMALSGWVKSAQPEKMTDDELDAISSATPAEGELSYTWDMTDESGERVSDGVYQIKVEGTLFWESNVLYTAEVDTQKTKEGKITVKQKRSEPDNHENESMIQNIKITAKME